MNHLRSVERHFSTASLLYDELAGFHSRIATELASKALPELRPRRLLDAACGTGVAAATLARRFSGATIDAIDLAPGMIARAQQRFPELANINWSCANITRTSFPDPYDVILSASALHWMLPIKETFLKLTAALQANGVFLFSLMVEGTFNELHALRREVAPTKIPAMDLPTTEAVLAAVAAANLEIEWLDLRKEPHYFESATAFLQSIRSQGFTGGSFSQGKQLLTRSELERLVSEYDQRYSKPDRGVAATYVIMMGLARRAT